MEEPGDVDARFFFWNIYVLGMKKQRVYFLSKIALDILV